MTERFNRNIYTFKTFRQDLKFMLSHRKLIKKTMQDLDHAFVEKIMTVVTAVNGCRYCSWFHARQAVSSGISPEEVQRMMKLQFQADASEDELMALLFAQHYAETQRQPSPEMTEKLVAAYGAEKSRGDPDRDPHDHLWQPLRQHFRRLPQPLQGDQSRG